MCMNYAGIEYHYGINVTIQLDSGHRTFHILMTNHLTDRPYVYSGLCLDNGLYVNTDQCDKYTAIYDIVKKITEGSINVEKAYAERYSNQPYQPLINITEENPELYKNFCRKMKNALSFEKYNDIRKKLAPLREKRKAEPFRLKLLAACVFISILPHCVPILSDCKEIYLASNIMKNDPSLNNSIINYRRV